MTLRTFLYAVDALMQEEGISFQVEKQDVPSVPSAADMRQQNAQAMQMFQGMMAGVK